MTGAAEEIRRLRRIRPRSRFVRVSAAVLLLLAALSWVEVAGASRDFFSRRRAENVQRFLREIRPWPLRDREFDLAAAARWAGARIRDGGAAAAGTTLAIAVAAAVLAGAAGLLLSFAGAGNVVTPEPFAPSPRPPSLLRRAASRAAVGASRAICILARAVPEYVLAFLVLAFLGPTPWSAVLALAVNNAGVLGRLGAETIENLPPGAPAAWRLLGATRRQVAAGAILPAVMPRFLLYLFYRFETCVREATVLGMLGIVSLGFLVTDARARARMDDMVLWVLVGAALVVAADVLSAIARAVVRRA